MFVVSISNLKIRNIHVIPTESYFELFFLEYVIHVVQKSIETCKRKTETNLLRQLEGSYKLYIVITYGIVNLNILSINM